MDHEPQPERPDPGMTEHTTRDRHPTVGYSQINLPVDQMPKFVCRCHQAGHGRMFIAALLLIIGTLAIVHSFKIDDFIWSVPLSAIGGLSFLFVPAFIVDAMQAKLRAHDEAKQIFNDQMTEIVMVHAMKEDQ